MKMFLRYILLLGLIIMPLSLSFTSEEGSGEGDGDSEDDPYVTEYDPDCRNNINENDIGGGQGGPTPDPGEKKPGPGKERIPWPPQVPGPGNNGGGNPGEVYCVPCQTDGNTPTQEGAGAQETECDGSAIGLLSKDHNHYTLDYAVEYSPVDLNDCVDCNSFNSTGKVAPGHGRLYTLTLNRYRRSLHYYGFGSFGRSQFSEFDDRITVFYEESWLQVPDNGGELEDVGLCKVFLAHALGDSQQFLEAEVTFSGDEIIDGNYRDRYGRHGALTLFVNGVITTDQELATHAQLRDKQGFIREFEIFVGYNNRRQGRLIRRIDRNGNITLITYQHAVGSLSGSERTKYWMMNKAMDPYGNEAFFTYHPSPYGIHYAVSQIDLPNNVTITYSYDSTGNLTQIDYPNGDQSTFAYGYDTNTQLDWVEYSDAGSFGTHRNKKAFYQSLNFLTDAGELINIVPGMLRTVQTPDGEDLYRLLPSNNPDYFFVYRGGNEFARIKATNSRVIEEVEYARNYIHDPSVNAPDVSGLEWEKTIENDAIWHKNVYKETKNSTGLGVEQDINYQNRMPDEERFPDSSSRVMTFNEFRQRTSLIDRNGRQYTSEYDQYGNLKLVTLSPGLPEELSTSFTYNIRGQITSATDGNGNITEFIYNAAGFLETRRDPADVVGGIRPETNYTYDSIGRLLSKTDPVGRITQYAYDARNRLVTITYNDSSTAEFTYGTGQNANLLDNSKDRNGNIESYEYDSLGRKIAKHYAFGQPEQISHTMTYLTGTPDKEITSTFKGDTVTFAYDYRNRVISETRQANTQTLLTTLFEYDHFQKLITQTDPYGRRTFFLYDVNDNVTKKITETLAGALTLTQSPNVEPSGGWASSGTLGTVYLRSLRDEELQTYARDLSENAGYIIEEYDYDSEGQRTGMVDARGIVYNTSYDNQGRVTGELIAVGTPVQAQMDHIYDAQGNVIEIQQPRYFDVNDVEGFLKARSTYTYNGRNLQSTRVLAAGSSAEATQQIEYHLDGRLWKNIDFRGNVWTTLWHACCGRLLAEYGDDANGVIYNTDYMGNRTHLASVENLPISDMSGYNFHDPVDADTLNEVTVRYDALNRMTHKTEWLVPLGEVVDHSRPLIDGSNIPIAGEDGISSTDGLTDRFVYDDDMTDGVGLDLVYASHLSGLDLGVGSTGSAVEMTNNAGESYLEIFDGLDRIVRRVDPLGHVQTYTYDAVIIGAQGVELVESTIVDELGLVTRRRSDGLGRPLEIIDELGFVTNRYFDANGNLLRIRDPNNNGADFIIDERNRAITRTDTKGDVSSITFDAHSNIIATSDGLGNLTTCVFDARNRDISCTNRINGTTTRTYDGANNLTSVTDAEGNVTTLVSNARNFLTQITYPIGDAGTTVKTFEIDGVQRIAKTTTSTLENPGQFIEEVNIHDMANRVLKVQFPQEGNVENIYTYDAASRIIGADSTRFNTSVTRGLDGEGKLISETLIIDGQTYLASFAHDNADRLISITYPNSDTVQRTYTNRYQLETVSYNNTQIASYFYDPGRREISCALGNGITTATTYFADNMVQRIHAPSVLDLSYTYNANKQKLNETDALQAASSQVFSYDAENRLTAWTTDAGLTNQSWNLSLEREWTSTTRTGTNPLSQSRAYSSAHEIQNINGLIFTHDYRGNMTYNPQRDQTYSWDSQNQLTAVDVQSGTSSVTYRYDAFGRRVQKTVDGTSTTFIHHMTDVIAEYQGTQLQQNYVGGRMIDSPIALIQADSDRYYYHANHLHSIEVLTDDAGAVVERYDYDAYGDRNVVLDDIDVENPYGYTGRRLDDETGLYYFRTRFYDADLGQFISRDRKGYIDGLNLYSAYFAVNGRDPHGTDTRCEDLMIGMVEYNDLARERAQTVCNSAMKDEEYYRKIAYHYSIAYQNLDCYNKELDQVYINYVLDNTITVFDATAEVTGWVPGIGQGVSRVAAAGSAAARVGKGDIGLEDLPGVALDVAAGGKGKGAGKALGAADGAKNALPKTPKKRGPKPKEEGGPHNDKTAEVREKYEDMGYTTTEGGNVLPEKLRKTPGGHKEGRRPDWVGVDGDGNEKAVNVGKQRKDGTPIKREEEALEDLRSTGLDIEFEPYN